jgi:RNA polymerase sigma-70 factor (ECF subfamily)
MGESPRQQYVMRLALEHRSEIWAFLMGLARDPHKAEDLFQNTYLIICSRAAQFKEGTNFLAWARTIARFEFLASVDPSRKRYVTMEAEVLESALDAAHAPPEDTSDQREALRASMSKLQRRGESAMRLRHGDGLSCSQVAQRLGLSANALYTLLSRERKTLQECVERRLGLEKM